MERKSEEDILEAEHSGRETERKGRQRKGTGGGEGMQTRKETGNDNAIKEIICPKF